ncbi:MAG: c-type cytochrome biogenesis protein CcmI [Azoarcus sp.]|jgi:cytochrome c-type biogenesis protein CcmH|nr:c-type cytochrome biogenesis protein CcmI [Azoarcus sp.]
MSGFFGFLVLVILLLAAVLMLVLPPLFGRGADAAAAEAGPNNHVSSALAVLREQLAELDADHAAGNLDAVAYAEARDELERRALEEANPSVGWARAAGHAHAEPIASPPRGHASLCPPYEKQSAPQVEKSWIFTLALGVPLLALVGYLLVGTPTALDPPALTAQGQSVARMAARAGELTTHLAEAPNDVAGWEELAVLRVELNDPAGAAKALARLSALRPEDADVLVAWAVAVAMRDQNFEGEVETLLRRALAIDPEHPRAQAMMRHIEQSRARDLQQPEEARK